MSTSIIFKNPSALPNPTGYSQVVKVSGGSSLIFVSGQVSVDLNGNVVGKGDIDKQMRKSFSNLKHALEGVDASLGDVVKLNTYVLNLKFTYDAFRKVRKEFLGDENLPASTIVEVSALASPDLLVEIEAMAVQKLD